MKVNEYIDFDITFMTIVILLAIIYFKKEDSLFVINYKNNL
jgi:hypothetical protein